MEGKTGAKEDTREEIATDLGKRQKKRAVALTSPGCNFLQASKFELWKFFVNLLSQTITYSLKLHYRTTHYVSTHFNLHTVIQSNQQIYSTLLAALGYINMPYLYTLLSFFIIIYCY